ncbi:cyclase-like protein 1 [Citrus sinensis]|uniref:cyclase-like protein 1 n=1 Tax=Citrus sinensis TaxID=2711 RepID=UPI000CED22E2|nr:cyclase-like protein 1 [Citrus sinensis]XP_024035017.1 uncharacterized protein LOC112096178 [Citrus x clementina]
MLMEECLILAIGSPRTCLHGTLKDGLGQFLFPLASIKNGSDVNASETKMSVRTGTHVNAPSHMFYNYSNAGFDADSLDLQVLNGPALLVDVPIRDRNITEQTGLQDGQ